MRKRADIENDHSPFDKLTLEVLLDVRDLLTPKPVKKMGRPKGSKNKKKAKKV